MGNEWAKYVRLAYSLDKEEWTNIGKFRANEDRNSIVKINFDAVEALYIRIIPTSWYNHPCIRAALYTEPISAFPKLIELYNPPEDLREYSSTFNNAKKGKGLAQSKLGGRGAWLRDEDDAKPWMCIDLSELRRVTGVFLQGRYTKEGILNQYTSRVLVAYSMDNVEWTNISEFNSNYDYDTIESISFEDPVDARYIRIIPISWNENPCIRAALNVETIFSMPSPSPTFPPELDMGVTAQDSGAALLAAFAALAFIV